MSFRRLLAITRKELRHIARERRTLFLVTVSPAFMLLTLAYIFSLDVSHFTLAVLDQDRTSLSRAYLSHLTSDGELEILYVADRPEQLDRWLVQAKVDIALILPPGFADELHRGQTVPVQLIADGTDALTATQAIAVVQMRSAAFDAGTHPTQGWVPVEIRTQAWFNPSLKSLASMVPGLLAILMSLPALALALALTREHETGTLEGLLATPVLGVEYLLGKMTAYVVSGLVSLYLAVAVARFWFQVPFRGALTTFSCMTLFYFGATMGLSLLVSTIARSQQVAMFVMLLVSFVPSFFLSGLILPIDSQRLASALLSQSLPATHFVHITRGVFLKGLDWADLLQPALILVGMGGVAFCASLARFRKRLR
jgi:ABC-2 type transport system permease protein